MWEVLVRNYKAVYNAMTAKPDCRSKAYPKNVVISVDDIFELNNRIFEKFKSQYEDVGFSVNVVVSLQGREKLEFPNWRGFEEHSWSESSIITGMVLVWEFNIKLPKYKVPERHTLTVRLSNGIRPEEFFALVLSGKLDQVDEIEQNVCPIVAKMDFIDITIGNEVLNIVSEWVKGLKTSEDSQGNFMLLMRRYRKIIAYLINYITLLCSVLFSTIILKTFVLSFNKENIGSLTLNDSVEILELSIACIVACTVLYKVSEIIANLSFKLLNEFGDEHVFNLTKGDKNQQQKFRNKEKIDRKKFICNIFLTVLINILCGIVTYFLTKGK